MIGSMEQSWLGLEPDKPADQRSFTVSSTMTGSKGYLFGGCAVAAVVEHLEAETGRPAVWITCQFVSPVMLDDRVTIAIDETRKGRRLTQAAGIATVLGERRMSFVGAAGGWDSQAHFDARPMPEIPRPLTLAELDWDPGDGGLNNAVEVRGQIETDGSVRSRWIWVRFDDLVADDPQKVAIAADFLAPTIRAAVGRNVYSASLDNTIRFLDRAESEWLLVELRLDGLVNGMAHGTSHVWAEDGRLLGIGSQTCAVVDIDER